MDITKDYSLVKDNYYQSSISSIYKETDMSIFIFLYYSIYVGVSFILLTMGLVRIITVNEVYFFFGVFTSLAIPIIIFINHITYIKLLQINNIKKPFLINNQNRKAERALIFFKKLNLLNTDYKRLVKIINNEIEVTNENFFTNPRYSIMITITIVLFTELVSRMNNINLYIVILLCLILYYIFIVVDSLFPNKMLQLQELRLYLNLYEIINVNKDR